MLQIVSDADPSFISTGAIVQGRYDVVCPCTTAWELHKRWPEAAFHIVSVDCASMPPSPDTRLPFTKIADAGHSANEPGITAKLIEETEKFLHL
jgi:proline iminopeptidase